MFAFQTWHSVLEMKLYLHRFLHLMDGLNDVTSLVFPKYNQYASFVRPLLSWIKSKGVKVQPDTIVRELKIETLNNSMTTKAVECRTRDGEQIINVGSQDLVFVTTDSMVDELHYQSSATLPRSA